MAREIEIIEDDDDKSADTESTTKEKDEEPKRTRRTKIQTTMAPRNQLATEAKLTTTAGYKR